ncbi:hypothetical protein AKJ16_DCAP19428 [Drosera capensis]
MIMSLCKIASHVLYWLAPVLDQPGKRLHLHVILIFFSVYRLVLCDCVGESSFGFPVVMKYGWSLYAEHSLTVVRQYGVSIGLCLRKTRGGRLVALS